MKKIAPFLYFLPLLFCACNKCEDIACVSPPEIFMFKFTDRNGKNVSSSFINASFKYTENALIKEIKLLKTSISNQETIFTCNELGWISAASESEMTFDLQLDAKKAGKLACKVAAKNENCCSYFEIQKLLFNDNNFLQKKDKDYCYLLVVE